MYTCVEIYDLKQLFLMHMTPDVAIDMKWFFFFNCNGLV